MNRSYRSIWNEALGAWVAASEISSARGKPNKSAVAKVVTAAVLAVVVQAAHASTIGVGTGSLPGGSACGGIGGTGIGPDGTTNYTNRAITDGSGFYSIRCPPGCRPRIAPSLRCPPR
ncbi:ESPR domain-containing protein, partial [Burkholderia pseudomallei]|uniref:ESPR domain-containing protein n=1 Tax=Burkholderia pseudomallei TaxID=28450 RepID=UPI001AD6EE6C